MKMVFLMLLCHKIEMICKSEHGIQYFFKFKKNQIYGCKNLKSIVKEFCYLINLWKNLVFRKIFTLDLI